MVLCGDVVWHVDGVELSVMGGAWLGHGGYLCDGRRECVRNAFPGGSAGVVQQVARQPFHLSYVCLKCLELRVDSLHSLRSREMVVCVNERWWCVWVLCYISRVRSHRRVSEQNAVVISDE